MRHTILLPLALFLAACNATSPSADARVAESTEEIPILQVATAAPVEISIPVDVEATGQVIGAHRAKVAAGTTGLLVSVEVERGDAVRKGQTLARTDDRLLRAALEQAQAALAQAEANVSTASEDATRAKALFDQGLSNGAALEKAVAGETAARAAVASAKAQVEAAQVRVDDARIDAPFDGVVVERKVSPGEYVRDDSPIVELVGTDGLRLQLTLGEREASRIAGGEAVRFRVAGDQADRGAVIDRVSPAFREGSRDLVVEALIEAPAGLRPGAFASAHITTGEQAVLAVPAGAVRTEGVVSRIFVAHDGLVEERIVAIGPEVDGQIVVLEGLQSTERVVADVTEDVRDGVRIAG